jgi:DNA-binding SARP family transcriptional activator
LHVRLLGGFRVERVDAAGPVGGWQRRSAKALTKLLATHPSHALHREQVLDILWPAVDPESALNGFGKALHAARRALEPGLPPRGSSAYLHLADGMVMLDRERVAIDADRFQRLAEDALRCREISAYETALAAYGGELLPEDRYEDWCADRRDFVAELRVRLLLGLAQALEGSGARTEAADRLREVLQQEPTREEVHRQLIRLYAEMGARDQAVRQFHICRDALRRDLDLAPQQETISLYEAVLASELPQQNPATRRGHERYALTTGEPRELTTAERSVAKPFVGREAVLTSLSGYLANAGQGPAGVVFLTGEAGVGKTRVLEELAVEAKRQGAAVLWGGHGAHTDCLDYGPFAIALEHYVASRPEAERIELMNRYPALARLVRPTSMKPRARTATGDHPVVARLLDIVGLLSELAATQTVLVVLGDLHGADPLSLDLVGYLAQLAITRRWILIGTVREEDVRPASKLARTIDHITHAGLCVKLELQCLSREDCDQLVRATLGGDEVDGALLERIYGSSRGNPLFVEELLGEMLERGEVVRDRDAWHAASTGAARAPARVRALVLARLACVDEGVSRILSLAAASGATEISLSELRQAATALEPPISEGALLNALDDALEMRILEERRSGYAFRYPLIRSALYEGLPRHRREQLDAALGRPAAESSVELRLTAA